MMVNKNIFQKHNFGILYTGNQNGYNFQTSTQPLSHWSEIDQDLSLTSKPFITIIYWYFQKTGE